jgi:hypothetical protein
MQVMQVMQVREEGRAAQSCRSKKIGERRRAQNGPKQGVFPRRFGLNVIVYQ